MDETGAYYTEWSKPERKKRQYSILMHIYGIKLFLPVSDIYVEYPMKLIETES